MNVQNISKPPEYVSKFINDNIAKLIEIYDEGIDKNDNNIGILKMICSKKSNKMDVQFSDEKDIINNILEAESWENLKKNTPQNKKIFMINDVDENNIFILHI